jgi:hypothetical protein
MEARAAFELQASAISGHAIVRVHYAEIAYETGKPEWGYFGERFDTVDHGIDLETVSGEIFSITWNGQSYGYGLMLQPGSIVQQIADAAVWDVTSTSRWRDILHVPINEVVVHWSWVEDNGGRIYYPQDLEIRFASDKRIFLSAAEYLPEQDALFPMSDNIVVIFDDDTARHYDVGPF